MINSANITSWYTPEVENLLDTSININFENLEITDITKIKFTTYDSTGELGFRYSQGNNLINLFTDEAQYWEQTITWMLKKQGHYHVHLVQERKKVMIVIG